MAGVRLGYAIASPEIITYMNSVRPFFNVNRFAQAAGIEAVKDTDHLHKCIQLIRDEKRYYYREFEKMSLSYVPTNANFIFVNTGVDDVKLRDSLQKSGVLVRPATPWGYKGFIRVTIGTHDQNEKMVSCLKECLKEML